MTLLLTRGDVAALLTLDECIDAVEAGFARQAGGGAVGPGVLALHVPGGGFHVKAAGLRLGRFYVAAKLNANFPDNVARRGLPTIQGVVVLSDGLTGRPLALLDSMEITALRTGAATAVAARHLARADARVATVVGCGRQGRIQIAALARVRPLELVQAVDADPAVAARFAKEMSAQLGLEVRAAGSLAEVAPRSDIVVTCTPSRAPLLHRADVAPGTFVGAVGADNETKQERLSGGRLALSRMRIYCRNLDENSAGEARPGFTLACLDHFDPQEFGYRLSTVRELWTDCMDLRPGSKECYVLFGKFGYAVGYGLVNWKQAALPEIETEFPVCEHEIYISNCYIIPESRGQKLYSYLLLQICGHARRRGARAATIAVNAANRPSVRGIESAGFVLKNEAVWIRVGRWRSLRWRPALSHA